MLFWFLLLFIGVRSYVWLCGCFDFCVVTVLNGQFLFRFSYFNKVVLLKFLLPALFSLFQSLLLLCSVVSVSIVASSMVIVLVGLEVLWVAQDKKKRKKKKPHVLNCLLAFQWRPDTMSNRDESFTQWTHTRLNDEHSLKSKRISWIGKR